MNHENMFDMIKRDGIVRYKTALLQAYAAGLDETTHDKVFTPELKQKIYDITVLGGSLCVLGIDKYHRSNENKPMPLVFAAAAASHVLNNGYPIITDLLRHIAEGLILLPAVTTVASKDDVKALQLRLVEEMCGLLLSSAVLWTSRVSIDIAYNWHKENPNPAISDSEVAIYFQFQTLQQAADSALNTQLSAVIEASKPFIKFAELRELAVGKIDDVDPAYRDSAPAWLKD